MAAKWKEPPRDALDTLTLGAVDMASLEHCTQLDYMPFDPVLHSIVHPKACVYMRLYCSINTLVLLITLAVVF